MPNSGESPPAGYALPGTCLNASSVNEPRSAAAARAFALLLCLSLARQRLRALPFSRLHLRIAALLGLWCLGLRFLIEMTVPGDEEVEVWVPGVSLPPGDEPPPPPEGEPPPPPDAPPPSGPGVWPGGGW